MWPSHNYGVVGFITTWYTYLYHQRNLKTFVHKIHKSCPDSWNFAPRPSRPPRSLESGRHYSAVERSGSARGGRSPWPEESGGAARMLRFLVPAPGTLFLSSPVALFLLAKCLPSWPPSPEIRTARAKFTDFHLSVSDFSLSGQRLPVISPKTRR